MHYIASLCCTLYVELNKNVCNDRLNVVVNSVASSSQGNLFQIWEAAMKNALPPNFSLVLGTM